MRRPTRSGAVLAGAVLMLTSGLLTGCGLQPTAPTDAGAAPTGIGSSPTLYFIGSDGELEPQVREMDRLGTVSDAVSLLLAGPGGSGAGTGIRETEMTRVEVTIDDDVIELRLPLAQDEVTELGIDQIVCTALATHIQGGGSTHSRVRILFTLADPGAEGLRSCPLLG